MLERHDCDGARESEKDRETEREKRQEDAEAFSPRQHQEGFWS